MARNPSKEEFKDKATTQFTPRRFRMVILALSVGYLCCMGFYFTVTPFALPHYHTLSKGDDKCGVLISLQAG